MLDGTHGAGCGREPIVKLLGALSAGGQSRRFGSDKALAVIEGKPLLYHVIDALQPQVDTLVMCGRKWPELACLADRPEPDQGPLAGLCAALHPARENDFQAVLTAGCETLLVPQFGRASCREGGCQYL